MGDKAGSDEQIWPLTEHGIGDVDAVAGAGVVDVPGSAHTEVSTLGAVLSQASTGPSNGTVRGMALAADGHILDAVTSLNRAMRLNPLHPQAYWLATSFIYARVGRTDTAVELWERIQVSNPDMILARIALAAHYEGNGEHEAATEMVREILRTNPQLSVDQAVELDRSGLIPPVELRERLVRAGWSG